MAPKGSSVTIVVSTGPQQVTVPNVTGSSQAAAEAAITAAGLVPVVSQLASTPANAGKAISTNPGAGTMVAKGTTVVIFVGTSSPTTTAPHTTTST
jgi:serine/threonine-protein kinase